MTNQEKETIRKIQATLISIDNQTPVFFNVAQYEKLGLTFSRRVWIKNCAGNDEVLRHTHHLTPRAKQYINIMV